MRADLESMRKFVDSTTTIEQSEKEKNESLISKEKYDEIFEKKQFFEVILKHLHPICSVDLIFPPIFYKDRLKQSLEEIQRLKSQRKRLMDHNNEYRAIILKLKEFINNNRNSENVRNFNINLFFSFYSKIKI